ncbi:transmembrane protein 116-like [Clytia hemisphaerica]|uniref:G-protein coupled receptors family 1 profile domain-containing protein n=1 Tax=Clytia hemisphaerica TaxID=252671 RepID=A0A7M5XJU4_9CNID|eukprot:TCONS_00025071-protein
MDYVMVRGSTLMNVSTTTKQATTTTTTATITPPPFETQLTKQQLEILSIIYLATGFLSLIGSISIIVISIKRRVVTNRTVLPLFHLCLADLFGSLGIIVGAISNNILHEEIYHEEAQRNYCIVVTMLTTASFMAAFLLTINYALQTYLILNERLGITPSNIFRKILGRCNWSKVFPILSWLFPFSFSMFIMFIDSHDPPGAEFDLDDDICTWCFPLFFYENGVSCPSSTDMTPEHFNYYTTYKATFLALIAITIIAVSVLFYSVFKKFKQLLMAGGIIGRIQYESIENVRNRTFILFGALFICWIFPLILGLLSLPFSFKMKKYFGLYVIEALTSPMQGFLNSIVYGWYNLRYRGGTQEISQSDERRPLIDPSNRRQRSPTPANFSSDNDDEEELSQDFWSTMT